MSILLTFVSLFWTASLGQVPLSHQMIFGASHCKIGQCSFDKLDAIKAKLVDKDGDGVPDEDRFRTRVKQAGLLLINRVDGGMRRGSAVAVSNRHVVTAGHLFAVEGELVSNLDDVRIMMGGCPGEVYQSKNVFLKTHDISVDRPDEEDYAVIELDRELCTSLTSSRRVPFGAPSGFEIIGMEALATGYYRDSDIDEGAREMQRCGAEPEADFWINGGGFCQYTSKGMITKVGHIRAQELFHYQMGQTRGGSGGPIFARINGEWTTIGIQFYEAAENLDRNFAIAIEGPFKEFVEGVVGNELWSR